MTQNESESENSTSIAQLEFDFTGYENDTIESDFSTVEKAHIDAITKRCRKKKAHITFFVRMMP